MKVSRTYKTDNLVIYIPIRLIWKYWQFVSAVVGLILTAVTAYRAFFVSRRKMNKAQPPLQREVWYTKGKKHIKRSLSLWTWRSHSIERRFSEQNSDDSAGLPQIPHGALTGIRTFIDGRDRTWAGDSHITQKQSYEQKMKTFDQLSKHQLKFDE